MKKVICFLLSIILIFALVGCNSSDIDNDINEDGAITDTSSKEEIVYEKSKTLYDFLPTYQEYLKQLVKDGIVTNDTSVNNGELDGRKYLDFNYKFHPNDAIYTVRIFYDLNKIITGIESNIVSYDLTDEPYSIFLKSIPNSLYGKENIINYVKENGIKTDESNNLLGVDTFVYTYKIGGIKYVLTENYKRDVSKKYYAFEIEIDENYEVKDDNQIDYE